MKTFLADIFPKIQRFSSKLDNLTMLTNQHWVSIDEILSTKTVYIFRTNNELLISKNGKVEKAKWEYLGNKSLLIDMDTDSYLFKHAFFDKKVLGGTHGAGSYILNTVTPAFDDFNPPAKVTDMYFRTDLPLLMLYLDIHKPSINTKPLKKYLTANGTVNEECKEIIRPYVV